MLRRFQQFVLLATFASLHQCKHIEIASNVQHAQVLTEVGGVYLFIHDPAPPASVIVKQCPERQMAVGFDCPKFSKKIETRLSLSNLEFEMTDKGKRYANELRQINFTPESLAAHFIRDYIRNEGAKVDMQVISDMQFQDKKTQLIAKIVHDILTSGLQDILNDNFRVYKLFEMTSDSVTLLVCPAELRQYCKADSPIKIFHEVLDLNEFRKALPLEISNQFQHYLNQNSFLATDSKLYNEVILQTEPRSEVTREQLIFIKTLNNYLPTIQQLAFMKGQEVHVTPNGVSFYACGKVPRTNPSCEDKSPQPTNVETLAQFKSSITYAISECFKSQLCQPGNFYQIVQDNLRKFNQTPGKIIGLSEVVDYIIAQMQNNLAKNKPYLMTEARKIQYENDQSEYKIDFFLDTVFYFAFNFKQSLNTPPIMTIKGNPNAPK